MVDLEGGPVMDPHLFRHLEPDPVCPQGAERPGTHYILRQEIKTAFPVQVIIGLAQVNKYFMEDRLSHENDLLKQL